MRTVLEAGIFPGRGSGVKASCVTDRHGVIVPEAVLLRGSSQGIYAQSASTIEIAEPPPAEHLEGTYVFGGYIIDHFGHLLLETFSRIHDILHTDHRIIFVASRRVDTSLFERFLEMFRIEHARVQIVRTPTIVERLLVPIAGFQVRHHAEAEFIAAFEKLGLSIRGAENTRQQPLYLSRTRLNPATRYFFGETVIEQAFSEAGFEVANLENLSLREQLGKFAAHRSVIGFAGSAFHWLLFCSQPKITHYLESRPINPNFELIERRKNGKPTVSILGDDAPFASLVAGNRILRRSSMHGPYLPALESIADTLYRQHGISLDLHDEAIVTAYAAERGRHASYFLSAHKQRCERWSKSKTFSESDMEKSIDQLTAYRDRFH